MGCDIHGLFERETEYGWENSGDPDIGRNYKIFSVIGNVRNYDEVPYIGSNRLDVNDISGWTFNCSEAFRAMCEDAGNHSHSYVTLKEIKEYDTKQKVYNGALITSKHPDGSIKSTCRGTSGEHMGPIGEADIFSPWGDEAWQDFIAYGEHIREFHDLTDEKVRFCFSFDN